MCNHIPTVDYPDGVIGPPWKIIKRLPVEALAFDPPTLHDCCAVAIYYPQQRRLIRCKNLQEAELRAEIGAYKSQGTVITLHGAMRLRSGLWYWPFVTKRVKVAKKLDPLKPADRAVIAAKLQSNLLKAARGEEAAYLDEALDSLAINWSNLSEAQIDAVVAETRAAAASIGAGSGMTAATTKAGVTLLETGAASRRASVLHIATDLARPDRAAIKRIAGNMPFFIKGDYGRRANSWAERDARAIIARGLRRGFDDRLIGKDLHGALAQRITNRSEAYFRMLANVTLGRASSYGQLTGYRDAGIEFLEWEAVLDGATCNICRFLHGTKIPVDGALAQFDAAEQPSDPEKGLMEEQAWFREQGGAIYVAPKERGGPLGTKIADVIRSAVGQEDQRGSFKTVKDFLSTNATQTPPAHGLCRCITVPVV